jgi:DNA-binding NarL/FixJ family response regulator
MSISILLVDDHRLFREGLMRLLDDEQDLKVVGQAADGREGVRLAHRLAPDVVVMDISMRELNGIEATRQITQEQRGCKVIALSMHSEPRFVAGILEAGAKGYVLKDCAGDEMVAVVRTVAAGNTYISPQVADMVVQGYVGRLQYDSALPPASVLSAREREVLQLLAEGVSTKDIADRLHLGIKTVESHRRNIKEKLGLDHPVDLARYALREGVTTLEEWLKF